MSSLLTWVEQSALGHFVRESGPWTYPLINLAHIVGIAALFGSVLVIDLTLLGVGRRAASTMSAIADAAAPVARAGFLLAAASGVGLLSSNASEYVGNPFFMIKFPLIALALLNAVLVTRSLLGSYAELGGLLVLAVTYVGLMVALRFDPEDKAVAQQLLGRFRAKR